MDFFDEINAHKYLFLTHISEPEENSLLLVVEEARSDGPEMDLDLGVSVIKGLRAIETTRGCSRYRVLFDHYVAYNVLNESFSVYPEESDFVGNLFRIFSRSPFLEFLQKSSMASDDHPGPFAHYSFSCQNHVVDVAACDPPRMERSIVTDAESESSSDSVH